MGGNAFDKLLPQGSFPRVPPAVYNAVKARILPSIQTLYTQVSVPPEAPEKVDYGDIDFIVSSPKAANEGSFAVPNTIIKETLGAEHCIPWEGNRTSNFAVPIGYDEWTPFGYGDLEARCREDAPEGKIYYQVDVHVCANLAEWKRVVFFNGYGDLGMILGLIARNNGLAFGVKGLKIHWPPNKRFELSTSMERIMAFFGLSMEAYETGFQTKQAVFEWVASSHLFDPSTLRTSGEGLTKVKQSRKMFSEFTEWAARDRAPDHKVTYLTEKQKTEVVNAALEFFEKREVFDDLLREKERVKTKVKEKKAFNAHRVRDWAELGEYWIGVKKVMDRVRAKVGGDEGAVRILEEQGEDALKGIVVAARDELGIVPYEQFLAEQVRREELDGSNSN